jgi:hypothetical protein
VKALRKEAGWFAVVGMTGIFLLHAVAALTDHDDYHVA